jgi:hypothetical protein
VSQANRKLQIPSQKLRPQRLRGEQTDFPLRENSPFVKLAKLGEFEFGFYIILSIFLMIKCCDFFVVLQPSLRLSK